MTFLSLADLVVVAGRVLELDARQVLDLVDLDAAGAALAEARRQETPEGHAAALVVELVRRRPFPRGNDRVALLAGLQVLALNGSELDPGAPEDVARLLDEVRAGTRGPAEVQAWVAGSLRCGEREGRKHRWGRWPGRKVTGMFERFTDRARNVVVVAQQEARDLDHNYIGTEHLLLGLLSTPEGVAARALTALGVSLEEARAQVERIVGRGSSAPAGHIPFTPRAKKVMELSLREALQLGHNYIGTEHVLLGLIREGEGVAAQVLKGLGVELGEARREVVGLLSGFSPSERARTAITDERLSGIRAGIDELFEDNRRLRAEVLRLRELLRTHGIEPDEGHSATA